MENNKKSLYYNRLGKIGKSYSDLQKLFLVKQKNHKWYNLSSLCVISIFFMIFGEAYGRYLIGDSYRTITAVISSFFLFLFFVSEKRRMDKLDQIAFRFVIIALLLLVLSAFFWSTFYNSYSYFGILIAFLIYYIDIRYTYKLLVLIIIICVVLEFYEYATQTLLFNVELKGIEMDEKELGGYIGVFRARGIFFGPLSAGTFMILSALLLYKYNWVTLLAMLGCFFANSRTGVVLLSFLLLIKLLSGKIKMQRIIFLSIVILIMLPSLLVNDQFLLSLVRIGQTGMDSAQDARMFFWVKAIDMFSNYPIHFLVFGDNGHYNMVYNNNPESGWLSLLVDNGIIGFLFYFIPIVYCLLRFIAKKQFVYCMVSIILIILNFVITAHLSGTNSLVYWLLMFELTSKAVIDYTKLEKLSKTDGLEKSSLITSLFH